MKISICIPCFTGQMPIKFVQRYLDIVIYMLDKGHEVIPSVIGRQRVERARNDFLIDAINENVDYLFFLDDDVIPPVNVIETLIAADKDIVSAPVKARNGEDGLILLGKDLKWLVELKEPTEIFACHMGATLIKRKVIDEVMKHHKRPFEFGNAEVEGRPIYLSEDTTFCLRAANLGYSTWAVPVGKTVHLGEQIECTYE